LVCCRSHVCSTALVISACVDAVHHAQQAVLALLAGNRYSLWFQLHCSAFRECTKCSALAFALQCSLPSCSQAMGWLLHGGRSLPGCVQGSRQRSTAAADAAWRLGRRRCGGRLQTVPAQAAEACRGTAAGRAAPPLRGLAGFVRAVSTPHSAASHVMDLNSAAKRSDLRNDLRCVFRIIPRGPGLVARQADKQRGCASRRVVTSVCNTKPRQGSLVAARLLSGAAVHSWAGTRNLGQAACDNPPRALHQIISLSHGNWTPSVLQERRVRAAAGGVRASGLCRRRMRRRRRATAGRHLRCRAAAAGGRRARRAAPGNRLLSAG